MSQDLLVRIVLITLLLSACSTVKDFAGRTADKVRRAFSASPQVAAAPTADTLLAWAESAEAEDDIPRAMFYVDVGRRLFPNVKAFESQARRLDAIVAQKVQVHFTRGEQLWRQGRRPTARREFLTVLRYQPEHGPARAYLTRRSYLQAMQTHTIQEGDTLSQLAQRYFDDPAKHPVIAYFNDMDVNALLIPGRKLAIPRLGTEAVAPPLEVARRLKEAQRFMDAGRYGEVVGIAGQILTDDDLNPKAIALRNQAYLQMGRHLSNQGRQAEALRMLGNVTTPYEGLAATQADVLARAREEIESLAAAGRWGEVDRRVGQIQTYIPVDMQIDGWLHRVQIQRAEFLRKQKKYSEALAALQRVEPQNAKAAQHIARIRNEMDKEAERQYIIGVKHYLKEKLQLAIKAWERTLQLNPEHSKARRDIANAQRLLEKLDTVE